MPGVFRWLRLGAVLGSLAFASNRVHAQAMPPSLAHGAELRIADTTGRLRTATYLSESALALRVGESCGAGCAQASEVPWGAVRVVDARIGHRHSPHRAVLGALIGAVGTVAIMETSLLAMRSAPANGCSGGACPPLDRVILVPFAAAAGGIAGAVVGWRRERFTWERVWPLAPTP